MSEHETPTRESAEHTHSEIDLSQYDLTGIDQTPMFINGHEIPFELYFLRVIIINGRKLNWLEATIEDLIEDLKQIKHMVLPNGMEITSIGVFSAPCPFCKTKQVALADVGRRRVVIFCHNDETITAGESATDFVIARFG